MFHLISNTEITHLLITYGYLAIFLVIAVESMGLPVPGEMTLMAASIYAGTTHHLHMSLVIAAAIAGAIVGDNLGYVAGRKGGAHLVTRYGKYVRLDERKLRLAQYLFDRHGGKMVFFGRFLPILRIWAGFLAGMHAMPWRRFLLFNAAGGAAWATLMGMSAFAFGHTAARMGGKIGLGLAAVTMVAMIGVMIKLSRSEERLEVEANRASHTPKLRAA
jgi:membrane protein DedA with SNARE-associated domain